MKRMFCSVLLFTTLVAASAQNPSKNGNSPVSTATDCGLISCISAGAAPVEAPSGAPVVIRSAVGAGTSTGAPAAMQPSRPSATPEGSSDFESLVQDVLGHPLPVFGSRLFSSDSGFAPPTQVAPPADYVIGTGDEVVIRSWGKIDIDTHSIVDRNGQIFLPRVGMLTVAGLRLDQLTTFLRGAISQQFTGFELSVGLGQLRTIQIFVLGQAKAPGVYTISSLSTLVNALFMSGGPSRNGTMRDIQVKRDGKVVTHFDVYQLLLAGDKGADIHLLPGDILFIPEIGAQAAVDGNVNTPGIYELKPGETIGGLLRDAGGLTPVAGTTRAVLERVVEHSERRVEDVALDAKGLETPLRTADVLRVLPIPAKIADGVTLRGSVAVPGLYAWHPGMRVSDLIPNREFLLSRAYYNRKNALNNGDGSSPAGTATHDTEINWNYAAIQRLDTSDLTTQVVTFALGEAIAQPSSAENKELQPGDVVVVYSSNDVSLPQELQAKFVRLDGQVKAPGVYRVGPNETLRELVQRAGGLEPHSYLYASELTRESVRVSQEAELKKMIERESQAALSPANQRGNVLASASGASGDVELRKAYLAELSKVHPDGRVVLRLGPKDSTVADIPDFLLEDGDHFFVPAMPNTVNVMGSVYNQGSMRYKENGRAELYVNDAGGATREADRKRSYIIRADGTIVSRQKVRGLEHLPMYPGDTYVVPPKLKTGAPAVDVLALIQVISAFALTAAAIRGLQ